MSLGSAPPPPGPRVAIVGSGISGLSAAHHLQGHAQITLFEAGRYFGGHTHTVDVTLPTATGLQTHGVDTGFLVYNERTYPELIALFDSLQVPTAKSDMSFSVQVPRGHGHTLEWSGANLNTVFAQRSNVFKPSFWRLLRDVLRFNRLATGIAVQLAKQSPTQCPPRHQDPALAQSLRDFLSLHKFSQAFRDGYLLPMLGCIWSCPTDQMLAFPMATLVRFCHNHGLLQVTKRPQWYTVAGGARQYVEKILSRLDDKHFDKRLNTPVLRVERDTLGVTLHTLAGAERFDHVILATHADQSLAMLAEPTPQEQSTLGAIRYHPNRAVLHTDPSVMPEKKLAWAAWNYERAAQPHTESACVCLHYWLNRLQPLPFTQNVFVSLNPVREIDPAHVLGEYEYAHPVFDLAALQAQAQLPELQGQQRTWFAGAWMGYGFHEDGFTAGRAAAQSVSASSRKMNR